MPDKANTPGGVLDAAAHNAEVARKLASQDIMGHSNSADGDFRDTHSALDELAAAVKPKGTPPEVDPTLIVDHTFEELEAKRKEAEAAAAKAKNTPAPADDEAAIKAKADADKIAADRAAELEKAESFFKDSPKLPANASPKSNEAFSSIKIKAAQDISARDVEIEKLKKDIAERDEKLKNPVPPELDKEVKELREWRAKLDVDADPKFAEFDKGIDNSREFIYAQLSANPKVGDALIKKIKELGGPDMVDLSVVFKQTNDPTLQRMVESKIADIEMAKFNKAQAIKSAKENISQYLEERTKENSQKTEKTVSETRKHFDEITTKVAFLKERPIDEKADAATKQAATDYNKWLAGMKQDLEAGMKDDSPQMKAILLAGMAQAMYLQQVHDPTVKELGEVKKQLAEANEKLARFKNAGVSRIRENQAPADGKAPEVKKNGYDGRPATEAIDDLARGIYEARAKAAANG